MKKILGLLLLVGCFAFGTEVSADVNVQGKTYTDAEYQELLEAVPEGYELVPNEKIQALEAQRAAFPLRHRAHIQKYGWTNLLNNNQAVLGTMGKGLRLEAIQLHMSGISYRVHGQTYGWQGWRSNGQTAGTTGQGKRIEAVEIKSSGYYGVIYRAHVQTYGWLGWGRSGTGGFNMGYAGTVGYGKRLEALDMALFQQKY